MRILLVSSMALALALGGCVTQDQSGAPTAPTDLTPADTSGKPGSGPGVMPSTGMPPTMGPP